jgi:hypothetical protein
LVNPVPVDYEQYTALAVTQHLVRAKAIDGADFFYRLQVGDVLLRYRIYGVLYKSGPMSFS